jgi:hypothetical protein
VDFEQGRYAGNEYRKSRLRFDACLINSIKDFSFGFCDIYIYIEMLFFLL